MKEAELKLAVSQYLEYKTNLGELYADRLNSGAIYEKRGDRVYGVKLCREGTADFVVLKGDIDTMLRPRCRIIFLELKGEKGKQSPEQAEFQKLVEAQGASYFIIRSIEELQGVLE